MEAANQQILIAFKNTMTLLDGLPQMESFLGMLDLRTGSMIISALCVLHPTIYGCTLFMPVSYLLLTIWFLLALFFIVSVLLFYGLTNNDVLLVSVWIWYSLLFVATMFLLMFLLGLFFISKQQKFKVAIVLLGILWYVLTIYFILVVNSHRKALIMSKLGGTTALIQASPQLQDDSNSNTKYSEGRPPQLQDDSNSNTNDPKGPTPLLQDDSNSNTKDPEGPSQQLQNDPNTIDAADQDISVENPRRLKALRKASG